MAEDLASRLSGLSHKELQNISQLAKEESDRLEIEGLATDVERAYALQRQRAEGNPRALRVLFNALANLSFEANEHLRSVPAAVSTRKSPEEYRRRRESIRDLILGHIETNPDKPRSNIPVDYFWNNVKEVRTVAGSKRAYIAHVRSIGGEPDSRVGYDAKTKTIYISEEITAKTVERIALRHLEEKKYTSAYDIGMELRAKGKLSIAGYMKGIAKKHGLKTENDIKIAPGGIETTVYHRGERPPLTATERVKCAIGDREEVFPKDIRDATGLNYISISKVVPKLGFVLQGTGQNRKYVRITTGGV